LNFLIFHIGSLATAFIAMSSAIVIARFFKSKKWWVKAHKALNLAAVLFALAGFVFAFLMVQSSGGPHIRVPHAILGLSTLILLLLMPVLGQAIFKIRDKKKIPVLKKAHRYAGRLTAAMFTATILAGLLLIGIL